MRVLAAIGAALLLIAVLRDAFYTMVLGRRAEQTLRASRIFYRLTWPPYAAIAKRIEQGKSREDFLSVYGPLSLLALIGLWAAGVILCFGALYWATGLETSSGRATLGDALYYSGTTLFAVGSPTARNAGPRLLNIVEAGLGIGFLGLIVSYLPVLYQSYSSRESQVLLLDARAGSPPSACELLVRQGRNADRLEAELRTWEAWSAELIQHHLSYPMLSYFRSQHRNQAWLASLVAVLDSTAVLSIAAKDDLKLQAEITFAVGRHVLVDLARVFGAEPRTPDEDRLPEPDFEQLRLSIGGGAMAIDAEQLRMDQLRRCREKYEGHAFALSEYLLIALPRWLPSNDERDDNWESTGVDGNGPSTAVSDPYGK